MLVGEKLGIRSYKHSGTHMVLTLATGEVVKVKDRNLFGSSVLHSCPKSAFVLARKSYTHYAVES